MAQASVRAVLWKHLQSQSDAYLGPTGELDPNALTPVEGLAEALATVQARRGEDAVRRLGHDYVALWARTFKSLVRHLRGRPERALDLWCSEVYPFLRGERRAARIDHLQGGTARVLLASDLPAPYLCGLLEAFVGLSRAEAQAEALGHELFEVRFQVSPRDRVFRLAAHAAAMRIPFLLAMGWAVAVGIAVAMEAGHWSLWRAAVTMVGALGIQAGANVYNDLRQRDGSGPLAPAEPTRRFRWGIAAAGYGTGAAAGGWLAWTGTPWILAYAAVGFVFSILYARVRDEGFGPILAGLTYGPLVVTGAIEAQQQYPGLEALWDAFWFSVPIGALAAAIVYLNDLADRPLDEASGRRTLLVRLPQKRHAMGFLFLVAGALGTMISLLMSYLFFGPAPQFLTGVAFLVMLVLGASVVFEVHQNVDDPHALTGARFGILALHSLVGMVLVAFATGVLP